MHFSISLNFKPCGKEQSPALFSSYDISFYYIFRHRAAALEWQDDTEENAKWPSSEFVAKAQSKAATAGQG